MSTKKFNLGNTAAMEPKFIELEGVNEDGEAVSFTFELKKQINGTILTGAILRGSQNAVAEIQELLPFIERCMKSTEVERFREVIHDEKLAFPSKILGEIWNYLVEVYSGRPLDQQSASSPGQTATPTTSTDASTSTESMTPANLTPTDGATSSTPASLPTAES